MLTKNSPIEIPGEDPFANCKLGRKEAGEFLTKLISTVDEPFVLALDAGWGKGKTTFIDMWSKHLKKEEFTTLYYNAWENDFVEDPLISFIGEIGKLIEEFSGKERTKARRLFNKTKKVGSTLIKQAIPIGVKLATYGALDIEKFQEKEIANLVGKFAEEKIKNYESEKNAIVAFRKELEKLIVHVQSKSKKPVVFFIDELDRCRPTFAIALLERLKHLFNVKGVVFVLGIDKEQLSHSVKTLYGLEMDADGYLRRFIDLVYELPLLSLEEFTRLLIYKFSLREIFLAGTSFGVDIEDIMITVIEILSKSLNLSLREIEQLFTHINIIYRTSNNNIDLLPELLLTLMVIKLKNSELYSKIKKIEAEQTDITKYLSLKGNDVKLHDFVITLGALLECAFFDKPKLIKKINSGMRVETETEAIRNQIYMRIMKSGVGYPIALKLISKIDLSESFKQL